MSRLTKQIIVGFIVGAVTTTVLFAFSLVSAIKSDPEAPADYVITAAFACLTNAIRLIYFMSREKDREDGN